MLAAPRTQRGFTLLEVLITLVIMAIGLLGLARLQLAGLGQTHGSYLRSQAIHFAYDMADRMRANPQGIEDGDYDSITSTPASYTDCETTTCTTSQLATFDAYQWRTAIEATTTGLPGGSGTVSGSGTSSDFTITISWYEPRQTVGTSFTLTFRAQDTTL